VRNLTNNLLIAALLLASPALLADKPPVELVAEDVVVEAPEAAPEAATNTLTGFHAEYKSSYAGFSGEVILDLSRNADSGTYHYEVYTKARGLAKLFRSGTGREIANFTVVDQAIVPAFYSVEGGSNDSENDGEVRFDWGQNIAFSTYEGEAVELEVQPGVLDRLSADVAAIQALRDGGQPGSYDLITRNRLRTYAFEYLGEERVSVPAGKFDTVKYRRQRPGSTRSVILWYAPAAGYLPVRMENQKNGKSSIKTVALKLELAN
jgi:hypothetical protein